MATRRKFHVAGPSSVIDVGYALHYVRASKLTGIERFSLTCAAAMARAQAPDVRIHVLASASAAGLLPSTLSRDTLPGDWRLAGEQIALPAWAAARRLDGVHVTAFGGSWVRSFPFALTVYDSVFWDQPGSLSFLGHHYYRRLIEGAMRSRQLRALVFISGAARDAVRRHFPAIKVPCTVVHASSGMERGPGPRPAPAPQEAGATVVSVGTIEPRKNLPGMAQSVTMARELIGRPVRWLHVGRRGWLGPAEHDVLASGVVEELGVVGDADLRELLLTADAFLSLSHLEGFNLPLAEALSLGTPAVVSDLPVHHEVAGDGALYADLEDPTAAATLLVRLLSDPTEWAGRSQAGWSHTAAIDPSAVALRLMDIYRAAFR